MLVSRAQEYESYCPNKLDQKRPVLGTKNITRVLLLLGVGVIVVIAILPERR